MKRSEAEVLESRPVAAAPRPGWLSWILMKGFRVLFLTVLWSGLGMAAGLLCGIFALMTIGAIRHQMPAMSLAYRDVAIPLAVISGCSAFVWNLARAVQDGFRRLAN